jgi:hypothetical protein
MKPVKGLIFLAAIAGTVALAQVETLPAPVTHANSFEVLSNSRYSAHSGFTSVLPRQILANVLWAMNRAPHADSLWELYIATPQNVYLYDPQSHTLSVHLSGNHRYSANSAFEVGIACGRHEEAGYAIHAGLLASVAFWNSDSARVINCPMQMAANYANSNWNPDHTIRMVNVYGRMVCTGLQHTVQAVSSDSSLPLPQVDGPDTFEVVLASLRPDTLFSPGSLTLEQVGQLLWAGFGVVPHTAAGGRRATTIASAVANYYLTRRIYLVRDVAVHRYHNRLPPGTSLTTSDHRIELVTSGDRRPELRAACPRLPSAAPAYIVLTVADTSSNYNTIEAGFAAFAYLMQAQILGLQGCLTTPIATAERSAIIAALGIPAADLPVVVFSVGEPVTAVSEPPAQFFPPARLQAIGTRPPVRIEYELGDAVGATMTILDPLGRKVREFFLAPSVSGPYRLDWDGTDESRRPVPAGTYLCRMETCGGTRVTLSTRITLTR